MQDKIINKKYINYYNLTIYNIPIGLGSHYLTNLFGLIVKQSNVPNLRPRIAHFINPWSVPTIPTQHTLNTTAVHNYKNVNMNGIKNGKIPPGCSFIGLIWLAVEIHFIAVHVGLVVVAR